VQTAENVIDPVVMVPCTSREVLSALEPWSPGALEPLMVMDQWWYVEHGQHPDARNVAATKNITAGYHMYGGIKRYMLPRL
jgi:hypothetical protein